MSVIAALIALGVSIVAFVAAELLRPKAQFEDALPAGQGDFSLPTTDGSRVIPLLWGTVRLKGPAVLWYGNIRNEAIREKVRTGLFSSTTFTKGYRYYVTIVFGLCRGTDATPATLKKIYLKDDAFAANTSSGAVTVVDPDLFGGDEFGNGGVDATVRFEGGTSTQVPDSYLESEGFIAVGGVTQRFTGTAVAVVRDGYIGNSENVVPWSFELERIPNGLGLATASVNTEDANPMNVVYEIFTNNEWGQGFPAADIDIAGWTTAATTLASEGNGFSFQLEREMEVAELLKIIERQIDGIVYLDHRTGLWSVKLARLETPTRTLSDVIEVVKYTPGTWEGTANVYSVTYTDRADGYVTKSAPSHDLANAVLQGGGTPQSARPIAARANFPGVKEAVLARDIAEREGRTAGTPLILAEVKVTREWWDLTPNSVIYWTNAERGIDTVAFRVPNIQYGTPDDPAITLQLIEDVFEFGSGSFAPPPLSNWVPPSGTPGAFVHQLAFEAPRAIAYRGSGTTEALVYAAARQISFASAFRIDARSAAGTPSGAYTEIGEVFGFMLVGELKNALARSTALPTTGLLIEADPDTQTALESAFTDNIDTVDVGTNLINLIMVGTEFMLPMSASTSGSDVLLGQTYRGVLDSTQEAHSAGDDVYLVFVGANVSTDPIPETHNVDVELVGLSRYGASTATHTGISFTMDRRSRRPLCPGSISLDGSVMATTASLEGAGGGAEATGLDLTVARRDYRMAETQGDEIDALTTDAATLFADFPTNNSTTVEVTVINDPDGTPATLFTNTGISTSAAAVSRLDILNATDGVLPTRLRLQVIQRHTDAGDTLASRATLTHDFDVTSALTGQFEFGGLDTNDVSAQYTADAAGQHDFVLSSSFGTGVVEYRLNGGSWTSLIAAASTSGSIAGVVVSDTIEVRHTSTEAGPKQLDMTAPGAGTDAFAILFS